MKRTVWSMLTLYDGALKSFLLGLAWQLVYKGPKGGKRNKIMV